MDSIMGLTAGESMTLREAARSCVVPGPVRVTSGRVVSSYVSGHLMVASTNSLSLIARAIAARASELGVDAIAGEETGGIPIVYSVASIAHEASYIPFFFRKQSKPPFGITNVPVAPALRVLLVDDVAGLGLAFERMVAATHQIGCVPVAAVALIDREDGAAERLAQLGVPLFSLFRYRDLTTVSQS